MLRAIPGACVDAPWSAGIMIRHQTKSDVFTQFRRMEITKK